MYREWPTIQSVQYNFPNKYGTSPLFWRSRSNNLLLYSVWFCKNSFWIFLSSWKTWSSEDINENSLGGNDIKGCRMYDRFWEIIWYSCMISLMRKMLLKKIQELVQNHGNTENRMESFFSPELFSREHAPLPLILYPHTEINDF